MDHCADWRFFNHAPEKKPWAIAGETAPDGAARMVRAWMGEGFPVESIEADILKSLERFSHLGTEASIKAYGEAVGREGRVMLAAIRRNFKRRPELWARVVA